MLQRGIFRIQSNNYDGTFLQKLWASKSHQLFSQKISILDVQLSSKYVSVVGLTTDKDIFLGIFWNFYNVL